MEIRVATAAEAPGICTLLAASGCTIDARLLADRLTAMRSSTGTALVALQWGPPSGLVILHWYQSLEAARPVAQVTTLLVGAEERRRGIGRMLVKAAAQAARTAGCGDLEILTTAEAPELQAFCRATGFAAAGRTYVRSLRKQG